MLGSGRPMVSALSSIVSVVSVCAATGEHSVCPNTMVNGAPSFCSSRVTSAAGTVEPPEQIALTDDRSVDCEGGMFEHGHQHRRHAEHRVAAVGVEQLEHEPRLECLQQHLGRRLGHRAEHAADAAAGVEQRHGGDEDVARVDPHAFGGVGAVVGEAAMMQQCAFRKARGARGILDHHGIAGVDVGKRDVVVAGGDEGRPSRRSR